MGITALIRPREKDLGEMTVRRVLPHRSQKMVGPFIFFDHMGPAEFPPGEGIAVRPHPHINLATVTYLFEGQIMHRDSLGYVQAIKPGAVNLMTAGRGIVHSERAGDDLDRHSRLHGIQSWMALPEVDEECEPAFVHHPAESLPELELSGTRVRIIMGQAWGHSSPVQCLSETLYVECRLASGASLDVPAAGQRGVYVVSGSVELSGQLLDAATFAVLDDADTSCRAVDGEALVMVLGGIPLGKRHIWWNFVSSSQDRIEQAKQRWRDGKFDPVPGDPEFIPLPES